MAEDIKQIIEKHDKELEARKDIESGFYSVKLQGRKFSYEMCFPFTRAELKQLKALDEKGQIKFVQKLKAKKKKEAEKDPKRVDYTYEMIKATSHAEEMAIMKKYYNYEPERYKKPIEEEKKERK